MIVKSFSQSVFFLFKITVSCISFGYIGYIFLKSPNFYTNFAQTWSQINIFYNSESLYLALFLVPINWGIEAYKWQFLAKKIESISFWDALKGVLAGLSLGFITPHAIGDYAARVYLFKVKHKLRAVGSILIARISLFYVTLFYGIFGYFIIYRLTELQSAFFNNDILVLISLLLILLLLGIINYETVSKPLLKFRIYRHRIHPFLKVIQQYDARDLYVVFVLSFARFGVFTLQYLLLLYFFEVDVFSILVIASIWLIFFAKSVFPSFNFLNDVGVREAAALFFLGNLGIDETTILFVSLSVWIINILIPSFAGLIVILLQKNTKD